MFVDKEIKYVIEGQEVTLIHEGPLKVFVAKEQDKLFITDDNNQVQLCINIKSKIDHSLDYVIESICDVKKVSFNNRLEYNNKIIDQLKIFFNQNSDMRFIQGLIALELLDSDNEFDNFHKESSATYNKLLEQLK